MDTNRATFLLSGYRWIITGIVSGLIFYLFFGAIIPQLFDEPIVERSFWFGLVYWSFVGIGMVALSKLTVHFGFAGKSWIIQGLSWGISMFVILTLAVPYFAGEEITMARILIGFIIFLIGGLGYGYVMKLYFNKQKEKANLT